jgi:hypothetical protein
MTSSIISWFAFIGQQITVYTGIFTLIAGILGGFVNIISFLSLRTFRQSSCAFYLTVMAVVSVGQLMTGLLSHVMVAGFNIDWTETSLVYCKIRTYGVLTCTLIALSCFCLAIIDRYLATCSSPRWQRWSNIRLARLVSTVNIGIWIIYNIPFILYYNQIVSTSTGKTACLITNEVFQEYAIYGTFLTFGRILPICITFFFGLLAYRNVCQLAHRTLPLVRRELDKQLTVMVLVQVIVTFFTNVPYIIVYILLLMPNPTKDPFIVAELQLANSFVTCLYYMNFGVSRY